MNAFFSIRPPLDLGPTPPTQIEFEAEKMITEGFQKVIIFWSNDCMGKRSMALYLSQHPTHIYCIHPYLPACARSWTLWLLAYTWQVYSATLQNIPLYISRANTGDHAYLPHTQLINKRESPTKYVYFWSRLKPQVTPVESGKRQTTRNWFAIRETLDRVGPILRNLINKCTLRIVSLP